MPKKPLDSTEEKKPRAAKRAASAESAEKAGKTVKTAGGAVKKEKADVRSAKSVKPAKSAKTSAAGTKSAPAKKSAKTTKTTRQPRSTGGTLIVVESPTKASTLRKILGDGYSVEASVGHVRDLPKGRLGLDVDAGFAPEYILVRGKAPIVKQLKGLAAASDRVLLASDPDREGEAIAWHLSNLLGIDPSSQCRIRMHEITGAGVKTAIESPEPIDMDKVNAQQARRVLDRLVGYKLSPLLWQKVQRGLSAGRVQSVALRLVCEREAEIEAFVPQEYWLIDVTCGDNNYVLRLEKFMGKALTVPCREEAVKIGEILERDPISVSSFVRRESSRQAMPPFRTSTLQQEASRRLGYNPRRTMRIAQSLYEGVEIPGKGAVGLITYMRTDSLRISPEAISSIREFVSKIYGPDYVPEKPNFFAQKGRAQDAHEAIRPTDATLTPDFIKPYLSPEQFRLYELLWNRTVASQMSPARVSRTTLDAVCGDYGLRSSGVEVLFEGWGRLWPLGVRPFSIPAVEQGTVLEHKKTDMDQRFTQAPSRYTEAGLVKALEEKGIGRPSTYATIIETLTDRGYTMRDEEDKKLAPTKLGRIVSEFLVTYFPRVMEVSFTADMENELDSVESGQMQWNEPLREFWAEFEPVLDSAMENAHRVDMPPAFTGEDCPECGKPLVEKRGRFGEFIACSGYPECRFTKKKVISTGIQCPKCEQGELVRRRSTKGKTKGRFFYGCTRYPECDFITWNKQSKKKTDAQETPADDQ